MTKLLETYSRESGEMWVQKAAGATGKGVQQGGWSAGVDDEGYVKDEAFGVSAAEVKFGKYLKRNQEAMLRYRYVGGDEVGSTLVGVTSGDSRFCKGCMLGLGDGRLTETPSP